MRALVIGGASALGRWVVRDLTESDGVELVTVADQDGARALETAGWAAAHAGGNGSAQLTGIALALNLERDPAGAALRRAVGAVDVVCNCAGSDTNLAVMEACADIGTHYVDLGGSPQGVPLQRALHQRFQGAGVGAVVGMGASPGTTSVMAALARQELDEVGVVEAGTGLVDRSTTSHPWPITGAEATPDGAEVLWVRITGRKLGRPAEVLAEAVVLPDPVWRASAEQLANGVPASVVAQFLAAGVISAPGVFAPEDAVPPAPYFAALRRRNMRISLVTRAPAVA